MCAKAEDGTHTLMKGDEVVEAGKEVANGFLFLLISWDWKDYPGYLIFIDFLRESDMQGAPVKFFHPSF